MKVLALPFCPPARVDPFMSGRADVDRAASLRPEASAPHLHRGSIPEPGDTLLARVVRRIGLVVAHSSAVRLLAFQSTPCTRQTGRRARADFTVVNGEILARAACLQDDAAAGDSPVSIAASMAFPMRSAAACRSRSPTWAYRRVILGWACPSIRATVGRGNAPGDGLAGNGMSEIVQADVVETGFLSRPAPEVQCV